MLLMSMMHDREAGSPTTADRPSTSSSSASQPIGLKRSFRDVIGSELASTMAALTTDQGRVSPSSSELDSLLSRQAPLPPSTSRPELKDKRRSLVHEKYGFAALGGFIPSDPSPGAPLNLYEADPKIHPFRTFLPGQMYEALDLNAYEITGASEHQRKFVRPPSDMPTAKEVRQHADYRNVHFLEKFISPTTGRILHRRRTHLPVHEQVTVSNCIKVARRMGLISAVARLDKRHLRRVREEELRVAQEKGLLA